MFGIIISQFFNLFLVLFLLLFCSNVVFSFYGESPRSGWWWYTEYKKSNETERERLKDLSKKGQNKTETLVVEKKEEDSMLDQKKNAMLKPNKGSNATEFVIRPLNSYTFEELMTMPLDQFTAIYNYYLERAVENPTEENVFYFMNLQDILIKRALAFTSSYMYVLQKYSDYFGGGFYPIAVPGIIAVNRARESEIKSYVESEAKTFGLLYFTKRGCPYCEAQNEINKHLVSRGLMLKAVDVDVYPWLAEEYGVTVVPAIYIVLRNGQVYPIGSGVMSVDDIYRRIYNVLKIVRGERPENFVLPDFQKGTPLDPRVPPPIMQQRRK